MSKLGALAVVGGSVTALLVGGQLATGAAAPAEERANRAPITANAPCNGQSRDTDIRLLLDDRSRADSRDDRYTVSVDDAAPNRRWQLRVAIYQGDSGSVGLTHVRTDDRGRWSFSDAMSGGRQTIDVFSRTSSGKRCEIELEARISPLG